MDRVNAAVVYGKFMSFSGEICSIPYRDSGSAPGGNDQRDGAEVRLVRMIVLLIGKLGSVDIDLVE
jgi:hypothetical protein